MKDILIEFQFYLNKKKLITDHDWSFEEMAKNFIKSEKAVSKNLIKPDVSGNETLPKLKIKKKREVAVCPTCKSKDIEHIQEHDECHNCEEDW